MSRKSNAKQFETFSELASRRGFFVDWLILVDKLTKNRKIWSAARLAYYHMMDEERPDMLKYKPKPLDLGKAKNERERSNS